MSISGGGPRPRRCKGDSNLEVLQEKPPGIKKPVINESDMLSSRCTSKLGRGCNLSDVKRISKCSEFCEPEQKRSRMDDGNDPETEVSIVSVQLEEDKLEPSLELKTRHSSNKISVNEDMSSSHSKDPDSVLIQDSGVLPNSTGAFSTTSQTSTGVVTNSSQTSTSVVTTSSRTSTGVVTNSSQTSTGVVTTSSQTSTGVVTNSSQTSTDSESSTGSNLMHLESSIGSNPIHPGESNGSNPIHPEEFIGSNPIHPGESICSNPIHPGESICSNPIHPGESVGSNPVHPGESIGSNPVHPGESIGSNLLNQEDSIGFKPIHSISSTDTKTIYPKDSISPNSIHPEDSIVSKPINTNNSADSKTIHPEDSIGSKVIHPEESFGSKLNRSGDSISSNVFHPEISIGSKKIHLEESIGSKVIHPEESIGFKVIHPEDSIGSKVIHPDESIGSKEIPPDESIGSKPIHPDESFRPKPIHSEDSLDSKPIHPDKAFGLKTIHSEESIGSKRIRFDGSTGTHRTCHEEPTSSKSLCTEASVSSQSVQFKNMISSRKILPQGLVGPPSILNSYSDPTIRITESENPEYEAFLADQHLRNIMKLESWRRKDPEESEASSSKGPEDSDSKSNSQEDRKKLYPGMANIGKFVYFGENYPHLYCSHSLSQGSYTTRYLIPKSEIVPYGIAGEMNASGGLTGTSLQDLQAQINLKINQSKSEPIQSNMKNVGSKKEHLVYCSVIKSIPKPNETRRILCRTDSREDDTTLNPTPNQGSANPPPPIMNNKISVRPGVNITLINRKPGRTNPSSSLVKSSTRIYSKSIINSQPSVSLLPKLLLDKKQPKISSPSQLVVKRNTVPVSSPVVSTSPQTLPVRPSTCPPLPSTRSSPTSPSLPLHIDTVEDEPSPTPIPAVFSALKPSLETGIITSLSRSPVHLDSRDLANPITDQPDILETMQPNVKGNVRHFPVTLETRKSSLNPPKVSVSSTGCQTDWSLQPLDSFVFMPTNQCQVTGTIQPRLDSETETDEGEHELDVSLDQSRIPDLLSRDQDFVLSNHKFILNENAETLAAIQSIEMGGEHDDFLIDNCNQFLMSDREPNDNINLIAEDSSFNKLDINLLSSENHMNFSPDQLAESFSESLERSRGMEFSQLDKIMGEEICEGESSNLDEFNEIVGNLMNNCEIKQEHKSNVSMSTQDFNLDFEDYRSKDFTCDKRSYTGSLSRREGCPLEPEIMENIAMFVETTEREGNHHSSVFSDNPENEEQFFSSPEYDCRLVDPTAEFFPHLERIESIESNYDKKVSAGIKRTNLSCRAVVQLSADISSQYQDVNVQDFNSVSPISTHNYIIPNTDFSDEFPHLETSLVNILESNRILGPRDKKREMEDQTHI